MNKILKSTPYPSKHAKADTFEVQSLAPVPQALQLFFDKIKKRGTKNYKIY
jgi:hypothetical protein